MKKIISRGYVRKSPVTFGDTIPACLPTWAATGIIEDLLAPEASVPQDHIPPPAGEEEGQPDAELAEYQRRFVAKYGGWVSPKNTLQDLLVLAALEQRDGNTP